MSQSSLAALSPSVIVDGVIFVALKSYFDGAVGFAGDDKTATPKCMTLTCLAADETVWKELEPAWEGVRKARGNPLYLHMTDAMSLEGEVYGNWNADDRDYLLDGLWGVLQQFGKNPRLHSFTCSIDLVAYERWKKIKNHPSPARLCVRYAFPDMLKWYCSFSDPILDLMDLYFDRGESFMRHLDADWKSKRIRSQYPVWNLIRTIAPVDMRTTPPIQMADMICWGFSRQNVVGDNWRLNLEWHTRAVTCANAVDGSYQVIGENELSRYTFPPEGSEKYLRQFRKERA